MYTNQLKHSALALAIGAGLTAGHAHGQATIEESFDYATGGLNGQGGTSDFGFDGNWSASADSFVVATNLLYGALASTGGSIGGLGASINRFGGARPCATALASPANLLADGTTLWFSVIVGYEVGANNTRLGFALANSSFSTGNFDYWINNEGAQLGRGVGFSLSGNGNGVVNATLFRDLASGDGVAGIVNGNTSGTIVSNGNPPRLLVGSIAWGATEDVITIYAPDTSLALGTAISTLTVDVDQSTFDTFTWARGDKIMMDEVRFGASSADVMPVSTVVPSLLAIEDNQGGGPIYEDIAVITYTLTFDQDMDTASITEADFDNAGDAVISIGTITRLANGKILVEVLPESTGTVQLRIPSGSVLSSFVPLNVDTTSAILDDTTITILAGNTPESGIRYWDGALTSGVTNGVSNGGNGTWNTTNTNWDKGAGFPGPVAWNNSNLATAVLGGSNGTITLGENITAGGITSTSSYTINGSDTLTFDVTSGTPVINNSTTLTINAPVSGSVGLLKTGAGSIRLSNAASDYSGGFTLAEGELDVQNLGTNDGCLGTGVFTIDGTLSPTIRMNRTTGVAWTSDNDCVFTGGTIRFTRPSGDTPKWQNDGNVTLQGNVSTNRNGTIGYGIIFNGDINDGGNGYSLSFNGLNAGRTEITLAGNNTYSGGTSLSDGASLKLNNSGALGLGSLTVSSLLLDNTSGSPVTLANNNPISMGGTITFVGTNDLNLGTGDVTLTGNRTFTVNAGTLTIGGAIGGGASTLTKTGAGTLALGGANTYTGNTAVNVGTLALLGGSQSSAITVASGASLAFTLGSSVTSTSLVDLTNGTVKIDGTPTLSSYTLMTADGGFTGTPTLDAAIPGYVLEIDGTALELNSTGAGTPYENWAGGAAFGDDSNGDGVSNGLAFLLGAADPNADALGLLPTVTETGGGLVMTFSMLNSSSRGTAALSVEHSSDLGITDAWTTVLVPDSTPDPQASDVSFTVTPNGSLNDVVATIGSGEAAGGKLFGRLQATE